jgi:hypothetical protein
MRSLPALARLLGAGLLLTTACTGSTSDDDDDDDDDDGWETGDPDLGGDDGGGSVGDGVSPVITEGFARYDDTGGLGIVAGFNVQVEDPNDDVEGGTFLLTLNDNDPFSYEIGGEDVTYNDGSVTLIFSNVDPEYYEVKMQVRDRAGNDSNVWDGEISW